VILLTLHSAVNASRCRRADGVLPAVYQFPTGHCPASGWQRIWASANAGCGSD